MRRSAGILMFKGEGPTLRVLLVHPGGPLWRNKDVGAWSIPKGEFTEDEPAEKAAMREFEEELGSRPEGALIPLGGIRQKGGKVVTAFAMRGDLDPARLRSGTFTMKWPPRGGRLAAFPEVDRAEWMSPATAREKIIASQADLIGRLEAFLARET